MIKILRYFLALLAVMMFCACGPSDPKEKKTAESGHVGPPGKPSEKIHSPEKNPPIIAESLKSIIYLAHDGDDANTGDSFAAAQKDLTKAFKAALTRFADEEVLVLALKEGHYEALSDVPLLDLSFDRALHSKLQRVLVVGSLKGTEDVKAILLQAKNGVALATSILDGKKLSEHVIKADYDSAHGVGPIIELLGLKIMDGLCPALPCNGAGINVINAAVLKVADSEISGCQANGQGAGIFVLNAALFVTKTHFSQNRADRGGGAAINWAIATARGGEYLTVDNCRLENNETAVGAALDIFDLKTPVKIVNNRFTGNSVKPGWANIAASIHFNMADLSKGGTLELKGNDFSGDVLNPPVIHAWYLDKSIVPGIIAENIGLTNANFDVR